MREWVFFFFQAEDGIRDVAVTGVQTCALPIWWKDDIPELRSGRQELDRNQGAFGTELWRANNVRFNAVLCTGVFKDHLAAGGEALRKNDDGAIGADGLREARNGSLPPRDVNGNRHAQQNALRAAAFFDRGLARQGWTHRVHGSELQIRSEEHTSELQSRLHL